ncbi:MAG: histidinol-phosphate transaminase [Nitrospinae bacterium]|nr:histidinol-phosphate transaminase [Nitrospinota bacterium]MBI3815885.1 histidinol-phosphate transaminase [Nitrospinota bacterium]
MFNIINLVKKSVQELKPYQAENIQCRIKLDAMENPYLLPESLIKKVIEGIERIKINRYPDPAASMLKSIISSQTGISTDSIIIGNGSDELIQMILTVFGDPSPQSLSGEHGDRVFFPVPTFSMYGIIARSLSLVPEGVPLIPPCPPLEKGGQEGGWEIPLDKFLSEMERIKPKVIFISYPNNPTGNCFSKESILKILEKAQGIVVIDEAYYDFSKKTFLSYLKEFKNLIILRTLSKIGMAGLRVGYLMTDKEICKELNKVRLPYNSNSVSQEIAGIILENRVELDTQIASIISERERLMNGLKGIKGIKPFPSETNFILFKIAKNSKEVFDKLLDGGILIRNFGNDIYLKYSLRVTIGTPEENDEFLNAIRRI